MRETTIKKYQIIVNRYDKEYDPDLRNGRKVMKEIADDMYLSPRSVERIVYDSRYCVVEKKDDLSAL